MNYEIHTIQHGEQRYNTAGDWYDVIKMTVVPHKTVLTVSVSDLGDERYEFLVALHELVEAFLCKQRGITVDSVDNFDISCPDNEPGNMPDAPYHREHQFATRVERMVAEELGVDWVTYEARLDEVTK